MSKLTDVLHAIVDGISAHPDTAARLHEHVNGLEEEPAAAPAPEASEVPSS